MPNLSRTDKTKHKNKVELKIMEITSFLFSQLNAQLDYFRLKLTLQFTLNAPTFFG